MKAAAVSASAKHSSREILGKMASRQLAGSLDMQKLEAVIRARGHSHDHVSCGHKQWCMQRIQLQASWWWMWFNTATSEAFVCRASINCMQACMHPWPRSMQAKAYCINSTCCGAQFRANGQIMGAPLEALSRTAHVHIARWYVPA